ncbi:DUF4192 domain-containing protein [Streptomyces sp. NPDC006879]|uniref:DUF4192 domain-containing protein n=1 Tax=Streptomyces sp. NPDC006879 TaxID=3364767 RepID=UPI0036B8C103
MTTHSGATGSFGAQITLRNSAELADALPYVLGFHPSDSLVLVAVHGDRGRFGGRLRLGIPASPKDWEYTASQVAECLVTGSMDHQGRPDGIILYLCKDPGPQEDGSAVMERLRPLAQQVRLACGALDVPVMEALCISDGRFWSYCCPDRRCCPVQGTPLAMPGTTAMAAAAAYAGLRVRGTLRDMEARLSPLTGRAAEVQEAALDRASLALVPKILDGTTREQVGAETIALAEGAIRRFEQAPPSTAGLAADEWDDALLGVEESATLVVGLQDREVRDIAAEWMEGDEAASALRLWRALARRCVGAYSEHAAAPLTLAGWVAWSTEDEPEARVALGLALQLDPDYRFARLLSQACNQGLDPEGLRGCLRDERARRLKAKQYAAEPTPARPVPSASRPAAEQAPGQHRPAVAARTAGKPRRRPHPTRGSKPKPKAAPPPHNGRVTRVPRQRTADSPRRES